MGEYHAHDQMAVSHHLKLPRCEGELISCLIQAFACLPSSDRVILISFSLEGCVVLIMYEPSSEAMVLAVDRLMTRCIMNAPAKPEFRGHVVRTRSELRLNFAIAGASTDVAKQ
jgi:hypothetical protein